MSWPGGPKHSSFWQRGWGGGGGGGGLAVVPRWRSGGPFYVLVFCPSLSDPRAGCTGENMIVAMSPARSHVMGWHQLQTPPGHLRHAAHLALAAEPCSLGSGSLSSCPDTAQLPRGVLSGLPAPDCPQVPARLPQCQRARARDSSGGDDHSDRE